MKKRKRELVAELEVISEKLISIQVCTNDNTRSMHFSRLAGNLISRDLQLSLEAEKRKPVPSLPVLHQDELDKDPFEVLPGLGPRSG